MAQKKSKKKSQKTQVNKGVQKKFGSQYIVTVAAVVLIAVIVFVITSGPDSATNGPAGSSTGTRVPDFSDTHALMVDPTDSQHLFYGNHSGLYQTKDGGKTWKSEDALAGQDAMAIALDGENIWAVGHNVVYASRDNGKTFKPSDSKLPGTDIHGFAAAPSKPGTLYVYIVGYGLHRSDDSGETWILVPQKEEALPGGIMAIAVDPKNEEIVYAGDMQKGILRSTDGGQTWKPTALPAMSMSLAAAENPSRLLAATDRGVYSSSDGTGKWSKLSSDPVALVAVSAGDPQIIYTVDSSGSLMRSEDNGATWK